MSPKVPSFGGVTGFPADAVAALRKLPEIAENTRAMKEHTAALSRVAEALDRVAADTDAPAACRGRRRGSRRGMPALPLL